jgi:hypothetical protein
MDDCGFKLCNSFWECLFQWQTLISAILALLAALITIVFLWIPIRQEKKRSEKINMARRATLPIILASLSEYTRSIAQYIRSEMSEGATSKPNFPSQEIIGLEVAISHFDNKAAAEAIVKLIQEMQVLHSRTQDNSFWSGRPDSPNLRILAVQIAVVQNLIDILFPFSRFERNSVEKYHLLNDLNSKLNLLRFDNEDPMIRVHLERQIKHGQIIK